MEEMPLTTCEVYQKRQFLWIIHNFCKIGKKFTFSRSFFVHIENNP